MKEYPTCQTCKYRQGSFCKKEGTINLEDWCSAHKSIKGNQNEETQGLKINYENVSRV